MKKWNIIFALILAVAAASCTATGPEQPAKEVIDDAVLVLNFGSVEGVGNVATKAIKDWNHYIAIANFSITIYNAAGAKVFHEDRFPMRKIDTDAYFQMAFDISEANLDPNATYKMIIAANTYSDEAMNIYRETWDKVVHSFSSGVNTSTSHGRSTILGKPYVVVNQFNNNGEYVQAEKLKNLQNMGDLGNVEISADPWRTPYLTASIENLKFDKGLNLLGFTDYMNGVANAASPEPAVILDQTGIKVNLDKVAKHDVKPSNVVELRPIYAQVIVNSVKDLSGGKFQLTDIFIMNTPFRGMGFVPGNRHKTFYFSQFNRAIWNNTSGNLQFCSNNGPHIVSGFLPSWVDDEFYSKTKDDNFVRLLHYPVNSFVSYEDFRDHYIVEQSNGKLQDIYFLSDYMTPSTTPTARDAFAAVHREMTFEDFENVDLSSGLGFTNKPFDAARLPIFLLFENDGRYYETSDYPAGMDPYHFATRLVFRGKWTENGVTETVYYPVLINGSQIESEFSDTDDSEKNKLVRRGRRYIFNVGIKNKGCYNPWGDGDKEFGAVDLKLKVKAWSLADEPIDRYIY